MTAIRLDGVSKSYRLFRERNQSLKAVLLRRRRAVYESFWALRDVTLDIPQGTTFAIIGENGSGKSTMLKCMSRILLPDSGSVTVNGRVAALLELGSGFHPELSGRENVYLNGSILGMSKRELDARFDEIVDFSGVERFIDQPVKTYSSGMYVRLGFSVAISVEPEILLVDEVLAVGDVAFQEKCLDKFKGFREEGRTVVIVTHAMGSVRDMCDAAAWLQAGELVKVGTPDELVEDYLDRVHSATEEPDGRVVELSAHGDGEGEGACRSGGPLTVRAKVERVRPDLDLALVVSLLDAGGRTLWSAGVDADRVVLPAGVDSAEATLAIDELPLVPGTYSLRAAVVAAGAAVPAPDRRPAAAHLVVHGPEAAHDGVLIIPATWATS